MSQHLKYLENISDKGLLGYTVSVPKIWIILLFSCIQHLVTVAMPFLFMFVITQLWFVKDTIIYIEFCLGFLIISSIWSTSSYIKDKLYYKILYDHGYNISTETLQMILNLPYSSIGNLPVESQFARFSPLESINEIWFEKVIKPLLDLPLVIFAYTITCYFLGFVYFVYISFIILITFILMSYKSSYNKHNLTDSEFLGTIKDTFANLKLIQQHHRDEYFIEKNKELIHKKHTNNFVSNTRNLIINNINESILMLIYLGSLAFAVYHSINGDMGIKYLIAIIILSWFSLGPLKQILNVTGDVPKAKELLKQLQNLMRAHQTKSRHKKLILDDNYDGTIDLSNIHLAHANGGRFQLKNINLTAHRGEVLFIYGSSGSGKSTLLKIIAGLMPQTSGSVTIEYDTKLLDHDSLLNKIIYISDDAFFSNTNIKNNLLMSPANITDTEILEFLDNLNIDPCSNLNTINNYDLFEFKNINSQKLPYSKIINNILVRKIPSNCTGKIIIIDEPLFSLDEQAFKILYNTIKKVKNNNTIIIASRNDIYAALADKIILLNNGMIENKWVKND